MIVYKNIYFPDIINKTSFNEDEEVKEEDQPLKETKSEGTNYTSV